MILYIDTYLSEIALSPNRKLENFLKEVQENSYVYRKKSKIDILKYTMASYALINWSHVIIRIDGDEKEEIKNMHSFIKECFPNADVQFVRSDSGTKYAAVLETLRKDNPWIFFSPNNDHPFIYKDPSIMDKLIISAERAESKFNHPVTLMYSHFTEGINSISPSGYLYGYTGDFCEIVDEDDVSYTVKYDHASLLSLQIFRVEHLYQMMLKAKNGRVIRPECLGVHIDYHKESIQIVPKVECCRHYDAYMHTSFVVKNYITSSMVPPLFIPDHFFDKKIKIRYGYDDYDKNFVNINPTKEAYIFNTPQGADLPISLEEIPAFWKDRVEVLDINPIFSKVNIKKSWGMEEVENPWRQISQFQIKLIIIYRRVYYSLWKPIFGNFYLEIRKKLTKLKKNLI